MQLLALGAAIGAAIAYFFDSQNGRRRRHVTRDRVTSAVRGTGRRAERAGRGVAAEAYGVSQKVQDLKEEPKDFDDVTLARKVETELFRPADAPKGDVVVNVEHGVVVLRGQAQTAEMIDDLVSRARSVQGVRDVESLLHLPGTPAPMHQ
jgi:osmotically-inducible protein OsmY